MAKFSDLTSIDIRFYEELNDFLPKEKQKVSFRHIIRGTPSIKDIIESLGVPHIEVDLIIVNGESVDFNYKPKALDNISVYPVFEAFDITPVVRLRPKPLRESKFVLDVHLGKLSKYLRLLGFDVLYSNQYSDEELVRISAEEHRIILTRDILLLKNMSVRHGVWIRNTAFKKQIIEVILKFDLLSQISPFTRCIECNGRLTPIDKNKVNDKILENIPPRVKLNFLDYSQCENCHKIYWKGSHYDKMQVFLNHLLADLKNLKGLNDLKPEGEK